MRSRRRYKNINTLWAGTDDGLIWITHDGGKNWSDITPTELTPWSKVTQIDASQFDEKTAYVSVSRFRIDDMHPYIFRTHDGGKIMDSRSSRVCPTLDRWTRCGKIRCGKGCCSRARRTRCGCRSMTATTGSLCN